MNEQVTIRQVALTINVDPKAFMLIDEMETVLDTQQDIHSFMTKTIELDCREPRGRRNIGNMLREKRKEKMREYRLLLTDFLEWFKVDAMGALSHLLVEKVKAIHIRKINEEKMSAVQIYELHQRYPNDYLLGILH
jgi:hypothetical protein